MNSASTLYYRPQNLLSLFKARLAAYLIFSFCITAASFGQSLIVSPPFDQSPDQTLVAGDNLSIFASCSIMDSSLQHNRPPFTAQWYKDGVLLSAATNITITQVTPQWWTVKSIFAKSAVSTSDSGSYAVMLTNPALGVSSFLQAINVTVAQKTPPTINSITTTPSPFSVVVGNPASITVSASGSPPLTYQWQLNDQNIAGATSATLSFASVASTDAGNYRVIVSNSSQSVTSNEVLLTVSNGAPPTITTQPQPINAYIGDNPSFSVGASSQSVLTYQWQKNGTNIADTAQTLTLTNVQISDAGSYSVIVTNAAGSATSNAATLTVSSATPATITSQPNPVTVGTISAGLYYNFSVSTSGGTLPIGFQWQRSNDNGSSWTSLTDNGEYVGSGTNVLQLDSGYLSRSDDQAQFRVVVSAHGALTISNSAVLTVPANVQVPALPRFSGSLKRRAAVHSP